MTLMTRTLTIIAVVFAGLLAGKDIDHALVAMPAWRQLDATAWAQFSRHADLGNGLILYPLEAFGGALFALAAALRAYFDRGVPHAARVLLYAAVALAVGGLVLTFKAAPIMLGIRGLNDPAALQAAFAAFWYWGNLRAVCQVLSFIALLAALAIMLRGVKPITR
jgi:hypothetical protein